MTIFKIDIYISGDTYKTSVIILNFSFFHMFYSPFQYFTYVHSVLEYTSSVFNLIILVQDSTVVELQRTRHFTVLCVYLVKHGMQFTFWSIYSKLVIEKLVPFNSRAITKPKLHLYLDANFPRCHCGKMDISRRKCKPIVFFFLFNNT